MTIKSIVCILLVFFVLAGCSRAFDFPVAKVTIKVVDESGNPLEGSNASITFELPKGNGQGIRDVAEKGITGSEGVFCASSRTGTNIAYSADKQGYYKSRGEYHFATSSGGRWQPWNPEFKLVLRKIINPVPMYARNTHMNVIALPVSNKAIGFDLIEYDWVPPYGKGEHADFIFKLIVSYINNKNFDSKLQITFSNKFDGIQLIKEKRRQGSMLKLPRIAPEGNYDNKVIKTKSRNYGQPLKEDWEDDNNYIFRIRSEEKDGKLIRSMYGKIHGDLEYNLDDKGKASIIIKYYLNPDYTRNLEFDPKQNLFQNLNELESVGLN